MTGLAETVMLVYAVFHQLSFSGGSVVYCYAGYKLLKRSATTYKWVTRGLWLVLTLLAAGLLITAMLGMQLVLTEGLFLGLEDYSSWLILVLYVVVIPVLVALLYHPETRREFGLAEAGKSVWTLYMGLPRASSVPAIGSVLAGVLLGPHLLTNPFQAVANALRHDDRVIQEIGRPELLALLDAGEHNWTFTMRIRAEGSKGTGFYYADLAPDGVVTLDVYARDGLPERGSIPRVQEEPAVPEASTEGPITSEVVTLLSTSFEMAPGEATTTVRPFVQRGQLPWARDARARSGRMAINVIPEGNPGKLAYFHKSVSTALLSAQLNDTYVPFRVEPFRRIELEFWRLSTSNPSTTHNCLGSLRVDYRLDGGEWQSKMVYCGSHKSSPPEWRRSRLDFNIGGHRDLEIRFEYEYPPEMRADRTVIYLIDDLQVRGHR